MTKITNSKGIPYSYNFTLFSAFNKTMEKLAKTGKSLKNFTYTEKEIADEIYSAINSTQFLGISVSSFYKAPNI